MVSRVSGSGRDVASSGREEGHLHKNSRRDPQAVKRREPREGPGMALRDGSVGSGNAGCLQHQDPISDSTVP